MPSFLIVNDDGVRSPFLPALARELSALGEVRLAVPLEERSWTGKAMTRHGTLRVHPLAKVEAPGLAGFAGFAVEGTPSDCANLGIHELFPDPPDWVVSGINIGLNAGLNFLINSGTVGAALEAALCGVPAAAFSQHMPRELHDAWFRDRRLAGAEGERLMAAAVARTGRMMATLIERGLPPGAAALNVNFPRRLAPDTPARWVPVLVNRYGSLFERAGEGFRHAYRGDSWRDDSRPGDKAVVEGGEVAVTALSLEGLGLVPDSPYPL